MPHGARTSRGWTRTLTTPRTTCVSGSSVCSAATSSRSAARSSRRAMDGGRGASPSRSPRRWASAGRSSAGSRPRRSRSTPASQGCGGVRTSSLTEAGTRPGPTTRTSSWRRACASSGGRIVCLPAMAASYVPRDSVSALARQYWRYGLYRVKTSGRHPTSLRPSQLLPPLLTLTVAGTVGPVRRLARPALALYGVAVLASTAVCARRANLREAAPVPVVYATMHLAYGSGFLAGCWPVGSAVARALDGAALGRGATPMTRLLVFEDSVYERDEDGVSTDRAFLMFAASLSRLLPNVTMLGRLAPQPGRSYYGLPDAVRFRGLPHYRKPRAPQRDTSDVPVAADGVEGAGRGGRRMAHGPSAARGAHGAARARTRRAHRPGRPAGPSPLRARTSSWAPLGARDRRRSGARVAAARPALTGHRGGPRPRSRLCARPAAARARRSRSSRSRTRSERDAARWPRRPTVVCGC